MATYSKQGGKIVYTMPRSTPNKGIPTTPPTSQAARDFASQPKSRAIKDPKLGYAGSRDPNKND